MSGALAGLALWSAVSASGLFAIVLLSLGTATGLRVRAGRNLPGLGRDETVRIHRHLTGLGSIGLLAHVILAILDSYAGLELINVLVPLTAHEAPIAYGMGSLALWALAAIVGTSLLRRWLPVRLWRAVHLASYVAWALGVGHAILAPSTTGTPMLVVTGACALLVGATALDSLVLRRSPALLRAEATPTAPGRSIR